MKKILFPLVLLILPVLSPAQTTNNPFEKYGLKKVMMATFSKGEFEEFHQNKEVVEIGSILYNTKTKEVVGYIEEEPDNDIKVSIPAMSIDPLCEKYPWISPYAYCLNNPVNAIDPDGRDIVFITKMEGKTEHLKYTVQGTLQDSKGRTINVSADSHAGRILDGYNKMLNSGDANYVNQITTLINSDNVHEINTTEKSSAGGSVEPGSGSQTISEAKTKAVKGEGIGTATKYNFSEKTLGSGLKKTNYTTVTHEVQHQYDFDQGNMKDHYDENGKRIEGGKNPAETRAIRNEDHARDQEGLKRRDKY